MKSSDVDKIELLKNEIAQRNSELLSLETIAKELPSAGTSPVIGSESPMTVSTAASSFNSPEFGSWFDEKKILGSSKVIESLQSTIDSLRRDVSVLSEKAKEERRVREAGERRFERLTEKIEGMKHQNEMFDSILSRKERKVAELEQIAEQEREKRMRAEEDVKVFRAKMLEIEAQLAKEKEFRMRAETSYDVVVSSARRMNEKTKDEVRLLRAEVSRVSDERRKDVCTMKVLNEKYDSMIKKRSDIEEIVNEIEDTKKKEVEIVIKGLRTLERKVELVQTSDEKLIEDVKRQVEKVEWMRLNC
ncbi:hypothetical protein V1512DRAFT_59526 [Lipomyces arxii]|uniref:uncharacterized protein n=1 Tax=Lipomyces arxii TaxID=56418 RepID=UPI0034CEAE39